MASRPVSSAALEKSMNALSALNLVPQFDVSNLVYPKIALLDGVDEKVKDWSV